MIITNIANIKNKRGIIVLVSFNSYFFISNILKRININKFIIPKNKLRIELLKVPKASINLKGTIKTITANKKHK